MKSCFVLVMLLVSASPLCAQSSITLWISSQQNDGGDHFPASGPDVTVEFDNGSGFGASYDHRFGNRFSGELSLFRLTSDGALHESGARILSLGDVELTPIAAMLQWHLRPDGPFDVYLGAGAAYVMTGDLESADLRAEGLESIPLDEEFTAIVGAGVAWNIGLHWGAALDARYLPLTLHARAQGQTADVSIDPLIISAGLCFRF